MKFSQKEYVCDLERYRTKHTQFWNQEVGYSYCSHGLCQYLEKKIVTAHFEKVKVGKNNYFSKELTNFGHIVMQNIKEY